MFLRNLDCKQIFRRTSGDVNFYRGWSEYKDGFGVAPGDFWLGNEAIYNLTRRHKYELRVDMKVKGEDLFAHYSLFRLHDESDGYRVVLGTHFGTLGQLSPGFGMSSSDRQKFSTRDRDNDLLSHTNCAARYHGAGWFKGCSSVNLNGKLGAKDIQGVFWATGRETLYPDTIEMKIRRL
ncbi:ficolin-2 [Elysia marginata]|uniref:Ficolin-2 n=1 Tax=Elysia marginata TaxID=1093978 RepID=A0AAV4FI83_9GAST|nr:ficolin-2 [Elysia marginata]